MSKLIKVSKRTQESSITAVFLLGMLNVILVALSPFLLASGVTLGVAIMLYMVAVCKDLLRASLGKGGVSATSMDNINQEVARIVETIEKRFGTKLKPVWTKKIEKERGRAILAKYRFTGTGYTNADTVSFETDIMSTSMKVYIVINVAGKTYTYSAPLSSKLYVNVIADDFENDLAQLNYNDQLNN